MNWNSLPCVTDLCLPLHSHLESSTPTASVPSSSHQAAWPWKTPLFHTLQPLLCVHSSGNVPPTPGMAGVGSSVGPRWIISPSGSPSRASLAKSSPSPHYTHPSNDFLSELSAACFQAASWFIITYLFFVVYCCWVSHFMSRAWHLVDTQKIFAEWMNEWHGVRQGPKQCSTLK